MASQKYLVAIDEGTSSCRALLIDMSGKIAGVVQKEFTQYFPKSGWVEHDPEEIWSTQYEVFEKLLVNKGIPSENILGIGITNQRETTVVWDRNTGKAVYNAIVWQDRRTARICEWIREEGFDDYIRSVTGLVNDAYFSGTKIKWILDNVKGAREKAKAGELCFGTIDSWLIYRMTKGRKHVTDYTNASRTMLFNIREKKWDDRILNLLDIPVEMLPEVQDSASLFGEFEYENYSIPICGVAGDQQAALFGQACFDPGMAKNTYGTGCFLLMNIGERFLASDSGLLTTLCCNRQGKPVYALEGSIFIAGAAIQWLRDGLKIISDTSETESMALEVKHNHDLVLVPAFTGLGAPYWNMYARGAIFGITRATTEKDFAKAALDSLAYQTRDVLDAMSADAGIKLKTLKVDGGAVANNYLMQFQADILNVPVERPEVTETTALGAAYLAGIQLGLWDYHTIRDNRLIDHEFTPGIGGAQADKLYSRWQKAVKRTLNWLDKDE